MRLTIYLLSVLATVSLIGAKADENVVSLGAKTRSESPWNEAIWGEPSGEPTTGKTYRLSGGQKIIGGGVAGDFKGAALKLDYVSTAVHLRGSASVNLLGARYGGTVRAWAAGPVELSGTADVPNAEDNLTLAVWDGSMTVRSKLAGCGTVNITAVVPGPFTFAGDASAFTGTICLLASDKAADYSALFNSSAPKGRLALVTPEQGKGRAVFQLKGTARFAVITVPRSGGGVLFLPNGRYGYGELKTAGADMACFADAGGTLEVLGMETNLSLQTALLLPGNADNTVSLAGKWRFALDPNDTGVQEKWQGKTLAERIRLPGILQAQGFGNTVSTNTPWISGLNDPNWQDRAAFKPFFNAKDVKIPYFSQPPLHYVGAAWYQRDIDVPSSWSGRQVALVLELPHWQTDVWVDGQAAGFNKALEAPHLYALGAVPPGRHVLTIRVDNRKIVPIGDDSHTISDQLGGTWNGIVGRIELQAVPAVSFDTVKVYPRAAEKIVRVVATLRNASGAAGRGEVTAKAFLRGTSTTVASKTVTAAWTQEGAVVEFDLPLGQEARLWDEFNPSLYDVSLELKDAAGTMDRRTATFGLRDFSTCGTRFAINGRPFAFRGTHFGGDFALTGHPAMDVDSWKRIFSVCKSYGLNAMRFHSWCPPEAAFAAADELGFYLQPECGSWSGFAPGSFTEQFIYEEAMRILSAYGNHPSFVMLCHGNEPWGQDKDKVLFRWVEHFKKQDPRRLYAAKTGIDPWAGDPSDYMTLMYGANRTYMRAGSGWFGKDYRKGLEGIAVPVMSHEIGEWFALPDFDALIASMTGYMRPGNIEAFRDIWKRTGMLKYNKAFVQASGRFQTLCYKEEIEANRRTPGIGGFQLLDLRDYLGQGTALVGVVDPLWNSKSYVTPKEYSRFCGTTAPLARMTQLVYRTSAKLNIPVEIAHEGPAPLMDAKPQWKVLDAAGKVMAHGLFPVTQIATGTNTLLGIVEGDMATWPAPARYKLVVGLAKTEVENDWNFWLYPDQVSNTVPADVLVTRDFDEAEARLSAGGNVLFLPRLTDLEWASPMTRDTPVFWTDLLACQWSRFMGIWCDPKHPALAEFPTDSHYDWQWRELIERGRCRAMRITHLNPKLEPIVHVVDQLSYGQKLAMVFECRVGSGRLLVCSADVESQLEKRTVARQLRQSLLDYAASQAFKPSVSLTAADLRTLLLDNLAMRKLGGSAKGDGQISNKPASAAIDGDPNTSWQSGHGGTGKYPHWLEVEFPSLVDIEGLVYLPQQYNRLMEGGIRGYCVEVSRDGTQWTVVAQGEWPASFAPQTIRFPTKQTVRKMRLTSLSGVGDDTVMSVAELTPLYAGPKLPPAKDGKVEYKKVRTSTEQVVEPEEMESPAEAKTQPNVVIILSDDLGFADVGFNGCKDVATPHIDSLAANGVRFTQGYVSAPLCSPSRAGLMTGRHQQRWGHDDNYNAVDLPLAEATVGDRMKALGYVTGMIGKWHLRGTDRKAAFLPTLRGFDEVFHPDGNAFYYAAPVLDSRLSRTAFQPAKDKAAYTTELNSARAVEFISQHKAAPFCLYLAFNNVHGPLEVPQKYIDLITAPVANPDRRKMAAMVLALDDAVGEVLKALRKNSLEDNTLVFFLNDNGGVLMSGNPVSDNTPFSGGKSTVKEGGFHVPFVLQWKAKFPQARTYDLPVSSLDVLPTIVSACGGTVKPEWNLDGVDLLPFLEGQASGQPHRVLCWRQNDRCAIRKGDWKLERASEGSRWELYNLKADVGERNNLAKAEPEKVAELKAEWEMWNAQMAPPQESIQPGKVKHKEE